MFKLLFLSSDRHPAQRVDVSVLFADQLRGRGHQIDFILQSESDCRHGHGVTWRGCRVCVGRTDNGRSRLSRLRKHVSSLFHDARSAWRLRSEKYDFVQLKDKYLSALFLIPLSRFTGAKFLYWLSYPFPEESLLKSRDPGARYPVFYRLRGHMQDFVFYHLISRSAAFIFVQSEQMKLDLAARGVPVEKMMSVPMGVKSESVQSDRQCAHRAVLSRTVVYLGTLVRVRKMDFLLRVFARVLETVPDARLVLAGGGDDEADIQILEDEAARLKISERVAITGWLPREEAITYVLDAGVCVSPFFPTPILNSTSPTKLVEYMALGKAVVANDHPEQRLVIEESGAGLCVPYEEAAFADAIIELLRDPERCREMGRKGRAYVEHHRTYDRIADAVEAKYIQLMNSPVSGRD